MSIPIVSEEEALFNEFGIYEKCVFCKLTTDMWHIRTNNPVCQKCSKNHKVSELHNWRKGK